MSDPRAAEECEEYRVVTLQVHVTAPQDVSDHVVAATVASVLEAQKAYRWVAGDVQVGR